MEQLKHLQLKELEMMKYLSGLLDQNNLNYFLGFGTLLGAVRHKGFIPWDDDVDFIMPREDFDRFRDNADTLLQNPYLLCGNVKNSPKTPIDIIIRIENPEIRILTEKNGETVERNMGIDIFPIDGMPKTKFQRKLLFWQIKLLWIANRFGRSSVSGTEKNRQRAFMEKAGIFLNQTLHIGKLFNSGVIVKKIENLLKKNSYEISEYVCPLATEYMDRCICRKEWFDSSVPEDFEDTKFKIPGKSDAILKQIYGNYLDLPPVEKRTLKHGIGIVEY